jgi:hypothetical protein
VQWVPVSVSNFADRHGGDGIEQKISAGGPQLQYLRVDGWICDLIRQRLGDHIVELVAQAVLQPVQIIPPFVIQDVPAYIWASSL